MTSTDDASPEELVQRFRDGDPDALCRLFERYEGLLCWRIKRVLPRQLQRRVSVADILQESRVIALDRRLDFEPRGPDGFRNWILGIAERKARRAVQRHLHVGMRAAGREVTRGGRPETGQFAASGPSPSQVAMGSELEGLTRQALATLSEDDRRVLLLRRNEQLPWAEVAARMGRSPEAVRKLYGRAVARLGLALEELGGISRG